MRLVRIIFTTLMLPVVLILGVLTGLFQGLMAWIVTMKILLSFGELEGLDHEDNKAVEIPITMHTMDRDPNKDLH